MKLNVFTFNNVYLSIKIYRGYSNFLLNMAFISPSEVEIFIFHEWRSHE